MLIAKINKCPFDILIVGSNIYLTFMLLDLHLVTHLSQWRRQNFNLDGVKLKDDIKSEINLKNINQQ